MKAKKSFGQNFLKDQNIINKIVNSIDINENDLVIEIGPGQGALTKELVKKNVYYLAFEIDERMKPILCDFESEKAKIIYDDFLKVNLNDILKEYNFNKLYLIANLPYYITTPIIEKIITSNYKFDSLVVMVQNEVADRFCALPKSRDYGYMTVLLNINYNLEKLFVVKNTCFDPIPKVDSAVVKFNLKTNNTDLCNMEFLKKFISLAFSHKRKTLKNNLSTEYFDKIKPILEKYNLGSNVRAEEIPVDTYIEMSNIINKQS